MKHKPNRSRRVVKKLLKRAVPHPNWNMDVMVADRNRVVTATEVREHGLRSDAQAMKDDNPLDGTRLWNDS